MSTPSTVVDLALSDGLVPPGRTRELQPWVDLGVDLEAERVPHTVTDPSGTGRRELTFRRLLDVTAGLGDDGLVTESFFVHKPPGLRWRVLPAAGTDPALVRARLRSGLSDLVVDGALSDHVYEPQQALFAGAASMALVHRSWSADARSWATWHAGGGGAATDRWRLSFGMLSVVLRSLGVVGWEDREVFDHVVRDTGRRLADHEWERPQVLRTARALRECWAGAWAGAPIRSGDVVDVMVADFEQEAAPHLRRWAEEHLSVPSRDHALTPRAAAGYWAVFHWNRAGIPGAQQALAAQAVAGRRLDPPQA